MTSINIIICGKFKSGKTTLAKSLNNPEFVFSDVYCKAYGFEYYDNISLSDSKKIYLWELSGNLPDPLEYVIGERYDLCLLCVDLSENVDEEKIKEQKRVLNTLNPEMKIILVATKKDSMLAEQNLQINSSLLSPSDSVWLTSAKDGTGINELRTYLRSGELSNTFTSDDCNPILKQRNRFSEGNDLYNVLHLLYLKTYDLPFKKTQAIAMEVQKMLDALDRCSDEDKAVVIADFSKNCHDILEGKHAAVRNVIISVLATVTVAVVAGIIGYGIGFGLGLWGGPLAFATGAVVGFGAATFAVSCSSAIGLAVGGLCMYGLFKETSLMSVVNELADQAHADYVPL